jgi:hypothetical protein
LDFPARTIQTQSAPENAGTKQYVSAYNDKAEPLVWTKKKVRQRRFKGRRINQL